MHAKVSPLPQDLDGRESTRPIRALNRALEVLTELNRLERAAINTLANAVRLPRTTTYRILETLRLAGYVDRDRHDDCYRPTIMVRETTDRQSPLALERYSAGVRVPMLGSAAVPLRTAVEQFLPKMREVAQSIETEFL